MDRQMLFQNGICLSFCWFNKKTSMKEFWENRYAEEQYAYGVQPNVFLKECLDERTPGKLLLPAEGEGRNAVYAALKGWEVAAFDYANSAKVKALELAKNHHVKFNYEVHDYDSFQPNGELFDMVALIYSHSDAPSRKAFNKRIVNFLKPNGELILEGFAKKQLGRSSGGPKSEDMLWDIAEISSELEGLTVTYAEELEVDLSEGPYHQGKAIVIRVKAERLGWPTSGASCGAKCVPLTLARVAKLNA
jgi:SAM-dependent methyltransferase